MSGERPLVPVAVSDSLSSLPAVTIPTLPSVDDARDVYKETPLMTVPVVKGLQALSGDLPTMPSVKMPSVKMPIQMKQHGGSASAGPGPVIAGALTAVVLAGGLKGFYDVIAAQYG
jgi:hypothetical protein